MTQRFLLPLLVLLALAPAEAAADGFPAALAFQGRLTEGGQPLTGAVELTARLWTDATTGTAVAVTTEAVTLDGQGGFVVTLGDPTPLDPVSFDGPLWLGLTVDEAGGGAEMSPRTAVQAVPQAVRTHRAETLLARTLHVDHTGDDVESGTRLLEIVDSIPAHLNTEPYTVLVGPGRYDLGAEQLTVPNDVAFRGAGRRLTTIVSTHSSGAVSPDDRAIVEDLRIEASSRGVLNQLGGGVLLRNLDIVVSGVGNPKAGISTSYKGTTIDRCRIQVTGQTGDQISGIKILHLNSTADYVIRDSVVVVNGDNSEPGTLVKGIDYAVTGGSPLDLHRTRVEAHNPAGQAQGLFTNDSGALVRYCRIEATGGGTVYTIIGASSAVIRTAQTQWDGVTGGSGTVCGRANFDLDFSSTANASCP